MTPETVLGAAMVLWFPSVIAVVRQHNAFVLILIINSLFGQIPVVWYLLVIYAVFF